MSRHAVMRMSIILDPLLIQVKQAVSSVLTPYVGRSGHQ